MLYELLLMSWCRCSDDKTWFGSTCLINPRTSLGYSFVNLINLNGFLFWDPFVSRHVQPLVCWPAWSHLIFPMCFTTWTTLSFSIPLISKSAEILLMRSKATASHLWFPPKTEGPTTSIPFHGIQLDAVNQTVSVLSKNTHQILNKFSFFSDRDHGTKPDLLSLVGQVSLGIVSQLDGIISH